MNGLVGLFQDEIGVAILKPDRAGSVGCDISEEVVILSRDHR